MSHQNIFKAQSLLITQLAGIISLIVFEILRAIVAEPPRTGGIPPDAFLIGLLCFSALPVLILSFEPGLISKWTVLVIAALLSLFHALHLLEHLIEQDYSLGALILIVMFLPSVLSVWLLRRFNFEN